MESPTCLWLDFKAIYDHVALLNTTKIYMGAKFLKVNDPVLPFDPLSDAIKNMLGNNHC